MKANESDRIRVRKIRTTGRWATSWWVGDSLTLRAHETYAEALGLAVLIANRRRDSRYPMAA